MPLKVFHPGDQIGRIFAHLGNCLPWALKTYVLDPNFRAVFKETVTGTQKNRQNIGLVLANFLTNSSGHPAFYAAVDDVVVKKLNTEFKES
jgi:butyrate kinase